jgi:DNA-binding MarR family transcriptional regulator
LLRAFNSYDPPLSAAATAVLLEVFEAHATDRLDELTQAELQRRLGLPQSTISRACLSLDTQPRADGGPVYGLVDIYLHPFDPRQRIMQLTPAGLALMEEVIACL